MLSWSMWTNILPGNYLCNVTLWLVGNLSCIGISYKQSCPNTSGTILHKKITYAILALSTQTCTLSQENNRRNVVLVCSGQHSAKQLYMQCRQRWLTDHSLLNVVQIRLKQHCIRKLLVQYWPVSHSHLFAGK